MKDAQHSTSCKAGCLQGMQANTDTQTLGWKSSVLQSNPHCVTICV